MFDYTGFGENVLTFKCTENTAAGDLVIISDNDTVSPAVSGQEFFGVAVSVRNGIATVATEGFITACIVFCVGSMTIMGSFEAGISGDCSIIFAKSALDFVSSLMFAAAMGLGVPFSALFILVFQGGLTLLAGVLSPYLSPEVVTEMSAVGGVILIGMGINMLELSPKRIKVANMLPAIFLPIAYIPLAELISKII